MGENINKNIKNIWDEEPLALSEEHINSSLKNLMNRINLFEQAKAVRREKHIKWHWLYNAASIVIITILLSSTIFFATNKKEQEILVTNLEYTSPIGEQTKITLPDSSIVYLNSGSILVTPSVFANNERKVLLFGEAYFIVAKDEKPFRVKTILMEIEALGTEFSVMSYLPDNTVKTTLVEGSIKLSVNDEHKDVVLLPSHQLYYSPSENVMSVKQVNVSAYTSWVNGSIIFDETPFIDIVERLEIQFGKKIDYNKQLEKHTLSAKFIRDESLDEILKILSEIAYFRYKIKDNFNSIKINCL